MLFHLYVPQGVAVAGKRVAPGSAIVSPADDREDFVTVDFEGNLYDAINLRDYPSRVLVAAYRSRDRAPTVARARVPIEGLTKVATFDLSRKTFVEISDPDRLSEWLGDEPIPVAGQTWEARHAG